MQYLFILGREPLLSTAELLSLLNKQKITFSLKAWQKPFCVLETTTEIDASFLMTQLGGTIKISKVFEIIEKNSPTPEWQNNIKNSIFQFLKQNAVERKIFFGLSFYNQDNLSFGSKNFIKKWGLEIKNYLEQSNLNSRLVTSNEETLSSVTVKKNKLLSARGAEIILGITSQQLWLAKTLCVQPFDEFSKRDFGRPGRDAYSGMLPPKLAKIMLNLAQKKDQANILDPFCGSGTILTEAYLMNYTNLYGSDISPKAIEDTQKNLQWSLTKAQIKICNATQLTQCYSKNFFDAIITEPYLGPPLKGRETKKEIETNIFNLQKLYLNALQEMSKVLKKDGVIIMIWPIIKGYKINLEKNLADFDLKINTLLPASIFFEKQTTLIYARQNQIVQREIVKLTKIAS